MAADMNAEIRLTTAVLMQHNMHDFRRLENDRTAYSSEGADPAALGVAQLWIETTQRFLDAQSRSVTVPDACSAAASAFRTKVAEYFRKAVLTINGAVPTGAELSQIREDAATATARLVVEAGYAGQRSDDAREVFIIADTFLANAMRKGLIRRQEPR
ncbi:MAG: hypothetical protein AB7G06_07705 [Bdellovibrionales bacterium]